MKNIFIKSISLFLIVILAVVTFGSYLPGASKGTVVEAAESRYMAKMVPRADGNNDNRLGQFVSVTEGKNYTLSFKICVIEKGLFQAFFGTESDNFGVFNVQDAVSGIAVDKTKTVSATKTCKMYLNFQVSNGSFYIWDIKLTEENSGTNLLNNADFTQGNGSFMNWTYSGWGGGGAQAVTSITASDKFEKTTGRKIILYNEELFSKELVDREKLEYTGDPEYMAKMNSANQNLRIGQDISVEGGSTYKLSFNYYVVSGGLIQGWLEVDSSNRKVVNTTAATGKQGVATVEYQVANTATKMNVRFECQTYNSTNIGEWYIWGITLTKDGKDVTQLLQNVDFTQGGGSWIGWSFFSKKVTDVETSMAMEKQYQREIISYDSTLFDGTNSDIAVWSVQPILEEALDLNYKTSLKVQPDEGTKPIMTFEMLEGNEVLKAEEVEGVLHEDGKYRFSFEILPQQMEHTIRTTLKITTNGVEKQQTKEYSVKEYCGTILMNSNSSDYLKDIIADLLRYGGETQKMFGKEDTITKGLGKAISGFGSNGALVNIPNYITDLISADQTNETYKWKSASLVLDGKVTIRLKFTTSEEIENLEIKVNNVTYPIQADTSGQFYYVDVPLAATEYDCEIKAQFHVGENVTGSTLKYSVNTYLYRKRNVDTQKSLLQSIYNYGKSAEDYSQYVLWGTIKNLDNEISDNWNL